MDLPPDRDPRKVRPGRLGLPIDTSDHDDQVWDGPLPDEEIPPQDPPEDMGLSAIEMDELRSVFAEIGQRQQEALRLFEPLPAQEEFFASPAPVRLLRGGNRGGKTLPAAVDCARAVTGQDPHRKYPDRDGRFMAVGWDLQHCADVMWRKLYFPGAFRIIRDPETQEWRSFRPLEEWDAANEHLSKPAPPLIPKRYIKSIAWDNKKLGIPKKIVFKTGWELTFYSSKGDCPQGTDINGAWFDEELENPRFYPETSARLLDQRHRLSDGREIYPRLIWSATPLAGTQQLLDLHARAETCRGDDRPTVAEFYLSQLANPHVSEQSKKEFAEGLSEDEYRVRVLGEFAILGVRVYPEFMPRGAHGCDSFPVPHDWTRIVAIDPGRQVCACLFMAIPPPSLDVIIHDRNGDPVHFGRGRRFLYDELYIERCNAVIFADRLRAAIADDEIYAFVIDHHAGRATEIGSGLTPEEQYSRALKAKRVKCTKTEYRFTWGSDDVKAGILSVRGGLHLDPDGRATWVVFRDKLKKFLWEVDRYSYKKLPSGIVTDEPVKLNDHLMDDWRYLSMGNFRYVKPKERKKKPGFAFEAVRRKKAKSRTKEGWGESIPLA